jgi:hypothetical protein
MFHYANEVEIRFQFRRSELLVRPHRLGRPLDLRILPDRAEGGNSTRESTSGFGN